MRICNNFFLFLSFILIISCAKKSIILQDFSLNSNDIISDSLAVYDNEISYDGLGSLHFSIEHPTVIELYEVQNLQEENCILSYSAYIKTDNLSGNCYLEMWCFVDGLGYFSRSLNQTITQDTNWQLVTTPFFLEKGQIAEKVKLHIVAEGKGNIWIDSIELNKKI